MGIVLDILVVVVMAAFILISYSKGAVKCVLELVSIAVSGFAAFIYTPGIAGFLSGLQLGRLLSDGAKTIAGDLDRYLPGLSEAGRSFAQEFKASIMGSLPKGMAVNIAGEVPAKIADAATEAIRTRALGFLLFAVVFFVCLSLLRMLINIVSGVFNVPLIGGANRMLGIGVGALEGILAMFMICAGVSFLMVALAERTAFITQAMNLIGQSFLFKVLYRVNPILIFF